MPLRIVIDKSGQARISGQKTAFLKYEKDILSRKIPCPFKVRFLDTCYKRLPDRLNRFGQRVAVFEKIADGNILTEFMVRLTPNGQLKIPIY